MWAHLGEDATKEAIALADAEHDAWMASLAGQAFRVADREIVATAKQRGISYAEAMEVCGYVIL